MNLVSLMTSAALARHQQWKSDPYAVNIDGTAVECGDYLSGKYKAGERKV